MVVQIFVLLPVLFPVVIYVPTSPRACFRLLHRSVTVQALFVVLNPVFVTVLVLVYLPVFSDRLVTFLITVFVTVLVLVVIIIIVASGRFLNHR